MRSLVRALRAAGTPIAVPWSTLGRLIRLRPGNLGLVIAAPGVGKSTMALVWAMRTQDPTLIVSEDTDLRDQALRVMAARSGNAVSEIEKSFVPNADPGPWLTWLGQQWFQQHEHPEGLKVRFADGLNDAGDLEELLVAETEYWGRPPALTVIDNVDNLLVGEENVANFRALFRELHHAARRHRTVVLGLHHLKRGSSANGDRPVRMAEMRYTGEQEAQLVMALWRLDHEKLAVGVLKQRMGRCDPGGKLLVPLIADLDLVTLTEPSEVEQYREAVGA